MKQLICLLFFCGLTYTPLIAQVHLKGQRFYDLQVGLTDGFQFADNQLGINLLVSTGVYNRKYNAWKTTLGVLQKPLPITGSESLHHLCQFGVGYGYEFNLCRNPLRTRFIRGFIQPVLLYESVRTGQTTLDSTKAPQGNSRLLLGGDVGFDIELSPLEVSIRQRWQPNSGIQPFHTLFSIGWRFHR
ncbi:conjugal transfer protein TraO [Fibrella aquatilis]|uniref:Conjugal transfer protein TraO n=1 Tax=Fibrella aquatilis TaxID=2817059 RepID=A0A939JY95_9BACT|nr:conjugal transfer protein TraO [Fibrella aquatilis]MBO0931854.1 conjugal transfer protein TraO [Fibrella aquatilis]